MELHQEFLDEVSSFLESEMLVDGLTHQKSIKEGGPEQLLLTDESVPGSEALHPSPVKASAPLTEEGRSQTHNSSSSEFDNLSSKKNKRRNDAVDLRLRKYRLRVKGEREELRQLEMDLSKQLKEILEARQGTSTTARTDLVLSKSFWKQIAEQQKERRLCAEKDKGRLLAIVNSQAAYLESLGLTLREQIDRQEHNDVLDPENTIAFKFRVRKTLNSGSTASILKRVVVRRNVESERVVIVMKVFPEGEGIFSGMDIDGTWWVSIRPYNDGLTKGALLEACSRRVPVEYITANADDFAVMAFQAMNEEAIIEDERESVRLLEKL
ncbi:uncharacterized protein IUM83_02193 [Phytophthora cinnamomi]|uniref:uncharacterized protein n=1 Tax=Phytophthora cinnamomi TaxID=4785 RepID=UPI003559EF59|nr:hypothetical protein IUM83_02193 [Phytophthora cinnamomi]